MEDKQFENDNFVLYAPHSLNYITFDMEEVLNQSLILYKELFNVDNFRKVQINYFDDIESFRNYIYGLRGEKNSLPNYAKATFDKGMINGYIPNNIMVDSPLYNKKKHNASHELFHIMYKELIYGKNNQPRIVWFDEGMAQFFSGEYEYQMNEGFEEWFNRVLVNNKFVPNLNELMHGIKFESSEYSGYNLSLLAVKYLYEKLGHEEFKKLIYDSEKIKEYGETIASDAIEYYSNSKRI